MNFEITAGHPARHAPGQPAIPGFDTRGARPRRATTRGEIKTLDILSRLLKSAAVFRLPASPLRGLSVMQNKKPGVLSEHPGFRLNLSIYRRFLCGSCDEGTMSLDASMAGPIIKTAFGAPVTKALNIGQPPTGSFLNHRLDGYRERARRHRR